MSYWRVNSTGGRRGSSSAWRRPRPWVANDKRPVSTAPVGPSLDAILSDDLSESTLEQGTARITRCEVMGSYNWVERANATILIPGMPPKWTPLAEPCRLKQDSGTYYYDRNAAHYPEHSLEAAVETLLRSKPATKETIDLFGCGSTLGHLLRFSRGDTQHFRIIVEVIGNTVHFVRREDSPRATIPDVRGYGHTFPEFYTTWDDSVRGSSSHQRMLKYSFAGMQCLFLFEVDGYLPQNDGEATRVQRDTTDTSLETLLTEMSFDRMPSQQAPTGIRMSEVGRWVLQHALFDLKTRSVIRQPEEEAIIAGEMPRLWLRQMSHLILAYHSRGVFDNIVIKDVSKHVKEWEVNNEHELDMFAALLQWIIRVVREKTASAFEITHDEGEDVLHVREKLSDAPSALSERTKARWGTWLNGGKDNEANAISPEESDKYSDGADVDGGGGMTLAGAKGVLIDATMRVQFMCVRNELGQTGNNTARQEEKRGRERRKLFVSIFPSSTQ